MTRPSRIAARLAAVETKRDGRRLIHPYRLTNGRTVRLSTLDVMRVVSDGLALRGKQPPEPLPVARTLAQVDPDDDPSLWGSIARGVAAEWCAAYDDGRPVAFHDGDLDGEQPADG